MKEICSNIDYCGVLNLIRALLHAGKCTETEAKRIAARLAVQYGVDIIISI